MAWLKTNPILSVIIPTINEADKIPLLLADLNRNPKQIELLVIDGGSSDLTDLASKLSGARVIRVEESNRGLQLHEGASKAKSDWLLFLHADSRLPQDWFIILDKIINTKGAKNSGWFFTFKVKGKKAQLRLLEFIVFLRSNILKTPYGDQGLLIHKTLYNRVGTYKRIPLMEDLDIVLRLKKISFLKAINHPLYTSGRKWEESNIFLQGWKNYRLRQRWFRGTPSSELNQDYYSTKNTKQQIASPN